eukprot:TRINITY_DN25782_c0_g1_i1.p1 TRINITY_DN25782_c0_g1~~TRINITY_DN25782_c0_g1_i1.p1  ORF type:complete len:585 (+),score=173.44 TRINITY_DN25782_c0_g1_i1:23-1756(+)
MAASHMTPPLFLVLLYTSLLQHAAAQMFTSYEVGSQVPLMVDQVVPEDNPSEGYPYFELGFCQPQNIVRSRQSLGEYLGGSRKIYSGYRIKYATDSVHEQLCTVNLGVREVAGFVNAIRHRWYSITHLDNIPMKCAVGETDSKGEVFLYVHHKFNFSYNREHVIDTKVEPDRRTKVRLEEGVGVEVTFTYEVKWTETLVPYEDRPSFNPGDIMQEEIDIQWFSIINSLVLVDILTFFLIFLTLRLLKRDIQKYDDGDDSGWKLLHADVFRAPSSPLLFTSILGCGMQLLLVFLSMLTLSVVGVFYPHTRGTMYAAIVVIYSLTSVVAGYVSGLYYKKFGHTQWVHSVLLTCTLFILPVFTVWAFLNSVAWAHGSTSALPFGVIIGLLALYALVAFPLTLAGGIAGRHAKPGMDVPCRTKVARRVIPEGPWWGHAVCHILIGGFLPFSAIYVELYYVFMSLWGHQLFTPYAILFLVFTILLMVTAAINISLTYLQISLENHEWWWRSLISGGATAFYTYAYSIYYYLYESHMYGDLQLCFFFGYTFIVCFGLFLMLSSVGFLASLLFMKKIYSSIKVE